MQTDAPNHLLTAAYLVAGAAGVALSIRYPKGWISAKGWIPAVLNGVCAVMLGLALARIW